MCYPDGIMLRETSFPFRRKSPIGANEFVSRDFYSLSNPRDRCVIPTELRGIVTSWELPMCYPDGIMQKVASFPFVVKAPSGRTSL